MTPIPVHYVPLERFKIQPPRFLAACGAWCEGADWSTAIGLVSCSQCQTFITTASRVARAAVPDDRREL